MTDRVIRIIVDTGNARQELRVLDDGLERVEKQERRTKRSTDALKQAFRALVGVIALREIVQASNTYNNLQNRIRLVTDSTAEFNLVQEELLQLAQRTRSPLEATGELYARVARSTEDLGVSQRQILQFTEAVNQSIQISGATAQEAAASTIQFAQGLAAGALRGDELRSVLEQNNRLARVIADEFGVGIGQLRDLGEAGELTADRIFEAVLRAGPELQEEFGQTEATLDQLLIKSRNFSTALIGAIDDGLNLSQGLNDSFDIIVGDVDETIEAVQRFALAFRTAVEIATIAVANFADQLPDKFGLIRNELAKFVAFATDNEAAFLEALYDEAELEDRINRRREQLQDEIELLEELGRARADAAADEDADLDAPGERVDRGGDEVDQATEKLIERQQKLLETLRQQTEAQRIANETGREYREVLEDLQIAALAAQGGLEGFGEDAQAAADGLRAARQEAEELAEAQEQLEADQARAAEIFEDTRTAAERYAAALEELQDLLDRGLIDEDTFERAKDQLDELDSVTEDFFRRARENSQDILADFFAGGFDSLDDFATAFSQMLLELASQALAANIFNALLGQQGSGQGGFIQAAIGAFGGRQFGGGVQGGQAVTTGEGGRFGSEIFVPNVGGTVMPATSARAAGAMPAPQVNLTSINTLDPSDIVGTFNDGAGDQVLLNRFTTKRTAFRRALGIQGA